uniref:Uncharacterized protein n=1 Tax=Micrurus spixii TaxID=129469 RepID=A0A2D4M541_9SAUR
MSLCNDQNCAKHLEEVIYKVHYYCRGAEGERETEPSSRLPAGYLYMDINSQLSDGPSVSSLHTNADEPSKHSHKPYEGYGCVNTLKKGCLQITSHKCLAQMYYQMLTIFATRNYLL